MTSDEPTTLPRARAAFTLEVLAMVCETALGLVALMAILPLDTLFGLPDFNDIALMIWIVLTGAYLTILAAQARRQAIVPHTRLAVPVPVAWPRSLLALRALLPVLTSLIGLVAALSVIFFGESATPLEKMVSKGLGVLVMVLAWSLLHTSYARRYQYLFHHYGGLEFPKTPQPLLVDFLYFSFTLGTTFAVSDVSVNTRRMRWEVIGQELLSFFYNAIVMATAFKILSG